jgi:hypothetical protein
MGPVGLASSLPALAPILAVLPAAVLLQEAHVPATQLQSMRALKHKHFPAYCLFASRKARSGGQKRHSYTSTHQNGRARVFTG